MPVFAGQTVPPFGSPVWFPGGHHYLEGGGGAGEPSVPRVLYISVNYDALQRDAQQRALGSLGRVTLVPHLKVDISEEQNITPGSNPPQYPQTTPTAGGNNSSEATSTFTVRHSDGYLFLIKRQA